MKPDWCSWPIWIKDIGSCCFRNVPWSFSRTCLQINLTWCYFSFTLLSPVEKASLFFMLIKVHYPRVLCQPVFSEYITKHIFRVLSPTGLIKNWSSFQQWKIPLGVLLALQPIWIAVFSGFRLLTMKSRLQNINIKIEVAVLVCQSCGISGNAQNLSQFQKLQK